MGLYRCSMFRLHRRDCWFTGKLNVKILRMEQLLHVVLWMDIPGYMYVTEQRFPCCILRQTEGNQGLASLHVHERFDCQLMMKSIAEARNILSNSGAVYCLCTVHVPSARFNDFLKNCSVSANLMLKLLLVPRLT